MLARVHDPETDSGPRPAAAGLERLCVVTREVKPVADMIRFVVGPDGQVVPDLKRRLPGRGVWVTASRGATAEAVKRRAFARGFKTDVRVASDLAHVVEGLLERRPHTRLFVVTDAVKGIDKDVSEQLLKDWGDEGVRLVKTKEVVEEGLVEDLARAGA